MEQEYIALTIDGLEDISINEIKEILKVPATPLIIVIVNGPRSLVVLFDVFDTVNFKVQVVISSTGAIVKFNVMACPRYTEIVCSVSVAIIDSFLL